MGFDVELFCKALKQQVRKGKMSLNTETIYRTCIERLKDELGDKESCKDIADAIRKLCANSQQVPKFIAAIRKYEALVLDKPKSLLYGQEYYDLKQFKQAPIGRELTLAEQTYLHKINALRNEKLKLAFRLQLCSGLRIAEVADLKPADIEFLSGDKLRITVRNGKGNKLRVVESIPDTYLCEKLPDYLERYMAEGKPNKPLFYKKSYMKKLATNYGLLTHDLRRLNARVRYREQRENGIGRRAARREVQHQLGHEKPMMTSAYIGSEWREEDRA